MSRKIAIIKGRDYYNDPYGDSYSGYHKIVESITEWEEVSDDEFRSLKAASGNLEFFIIEQPVDTKKFIAKTIADYKALVKAEEERAAEEKRKREEAALQRKFKKELKDKASKEKMLAKLAEELGVSLPDSAE